MEEELYGTIEEYQDTKHMIYAKFVYDVSYNKDKKEFHCDCPGFQYRKKCKHIEKLEEKMKREKFENNPEGELDDDPSPRNNFK
ncbi:MAG: SWIM zinc finger domain-containing protein [Candidatus Methanofastidiosia archaeon]|jgi:hypothetical protein